MKKLFLFLTIIIILIIGSVYGTLFTKYGNGIIASYIENKVNDGQEDVKLKVNDFRLTFNTINFDAKINDDSQILITGDLAIFKQSVDLKYDIKINDLATLKNLTKQDLKGPFSTNGTFVGDKNNAVIQGFTNIALSQTDYHVNLVNFEPKNININLKDAKIQELLSLLNKPIYATGDLNITADIKNIDVTNLDGIVKANISKGKINNDVVNKEFKQSINTSINIETNINASLLGKKVEVKSELISSVADIFLDKTVIDLEKNKSFSDYRIDVKNLNKLEGVIGKKLNGDFYTSGNIFLENSNISIAGNSNIFESTSTYNLKLKDSNLENINFKIEDAKIEKLLHMLNEPVYATGNLNIDGDIKNAKIETLNGLINTKITEGKIINEVVNTVFKQEIKDIVTFDLNVDTSLVPNQAVSKASLNTNLLDLNINQAVFDFNEASLNSDYLVKIVSLTNLVDFTKTKLRGAMDISGNIQSKENLLLKALSNYFDNNGNFVKYGNGLELVEYSEYFEDSYLEDLMHKVSLKSTKGDKIKLPKNKYIAIFRK